MKVSIVVNQQLDLCGDEFLNERDFEITFKFDSKSNGLVWFDIEEFGITDCNVSRDDLLTLARALGGTL